MNATTHLEETCPMCVEGVVPDRVTLWRTCPDCNGSTRRLRGTHDAASAIDAEPDLPTPERWARIREMAAVCRDPANSDAVRALLDEVGR